jgi:hypothetical protein
VQGRRAEEAKHTRILEQPCAKACATAGASTVKAPNKT